ncbi:NACHT and WD40 domain protein [Penicillium malachiteum]|uniref:Mitochondrial division protein 1 n=1 Tax=Penicillium malachiteum TaxID=1324776 RepID=A0AAD6HTU1_9EURO|nr:NACHT and WD40 domain protein [Penicillium malachiteum]
MDKNAIHTVAFSPDDRLVRSASSANVKVWDTTDSSVRYRLLMEQSCPVVSISPDGKLLAVQYWKHVEIYDSITGNLLKTIYQHSPWVSPYVKSTRFLPDCSSIAIALDASLDLWDLSPEFEQVTGSELDRVSGVTISRDGTFGASSSLDFNTTVKIWDTAKEVVIHDLIVEPGRVQGLRLSPDERLLLSLAGDGSLMLWDTGTGRKACTLRPQCQSGSLLAFMEAIIFSPDSQILSSSWVDLEPERPKELPIYLWNTNTGELIHVLQYPLELECRPVVFSPDGKIVATAARSHNGGDSRVLLWCTESGSLIYDVENKGSFPWLEFSADGKILAYAVEHGVELCHLG